jgi:hypothetical protein
MRLAMAYRTHAEIGLLLLCSRPRLPLNRRRKGFSSGLPVQVCDTSNLAPVVRWHSDRCGSRRPRLIASNPEYTGVVQRGHQMTQDGLVETTEQCQTAL